MKSRPLACALYIKSACSNSGQIVWPNADKALHPTENLIVVFGRVDLVVMQGESASVSIVQLNTPVSGQALEQIDFYRRRVAELQRNWDELESNGFSVSAWIGAGSDGKLNTSSMPVSIHRLKGLYIDFRFLWGNDEPSCFNKIQKLVGKNCNNSESVKRCLQANKKQWDQAVVGKQWHGLNAEQMTSAILYGAVIHEAADKQASLAQINSLLSESAAHHMLASTIWARMFPLKSLVWMLEPLTADEQVVQVPDAFA